ncbi:IS110 family transposase (plasmid) [Vibrio metschnikovii]
MNKNHKLLQSIVGIGKVMSRELVYLFSAKKFSSAKQAAAFIGLIPQLNESGKLKGRTTMSKVRPSRIRAKLFLADVSASTHNPDIKEQRRRLLVAGKT